MIALEDANVVWHDLECGAYTADLETWRELAEARAGQVLDLGCGTGRVALALAGAGHGVTGLDLDSALVAELERRRGQLPLAALSGDATSFELAERFAVVLAPMQLIQLLDGPTARERCLCRVARHLRPGGLFAAAIVDGAPPVAMPDETWAPPLPDAREAGGWVYSSLPLETHVDETTIVVRRLRQVVSPTGELSEEVEETVLRRLSAERLVREGSAVGLSPAGRRQIPATDAHVGSTVVLLEKGR